MEIKISVDNDLLNKKDLNLFIKEFKNSLGKGVISGEYKSEFLNFKWEMTDKLLK